MPRARLKSLGIREKQELVGLLEEAERRKRQHLIETMYPETGPLRRELYARHMQFFRLGAQPGINERGFMAANRVGKTWGAGGYELTLHLTGDYPDWWEGRRFAHVTLQKSDFDNARRIVNGTDKAGEIAAIARDYDAALTAIGYDEAKPTDAAPSIPAPSKPPAVEAMPGRKPTAARGLLEWLFSLFTGGF
jgi:hypothetical protein